MIYKRLIGLDIGHVRIGIACSDLMRIISSPYETYKRKNIDDQDFEYLAKFAKDKEADTIVCGMPYNMDGTDSEQTTRVREFIEKLKTFTDCKIVDVDERLSSWEADQMMLEDDVSREDRKLSIDKIAASIILESYMRTL